MSSTGGVPDTGSSQPHRVSENVKKGLKIGAIGFAAFAAIGSLSTLALLQTDLLDLTMIAKPLGEYSVAAQISLGAVGAASAAGAVFGVVKSVKKSEGDENIIAPDEKAKFAIPGIQKMIQDGKLNLGPFKIVVVSVADAPGANRVNNEAAIKYIKNNIDRVPNFDKDKTIILLLQNSGKVLPGVYNETLKEYNVVSFQKGIFGGVPKYNPPMMKDGGTQNPGNHDKLKKILSPQFSKSKIIQQFPLE